MRLDGATVDLILRAVAGARVGSGGRVRVRCPLCLIRTGKEDRRGAFSFDPTAGWFGCFKCGARGRLQGYEGRAIEPGVGKSQVPPPQRPEGWVPLWCDPGDTAMVTAPARRYLACRGIGPELIRAAHLGAALRGPHEGRVIIPVFAEDGEVWRGWSARAWVPRHPLPYLYPGHMPRGEVLYNHAAIHRETDEPVLVVEGCFDALALWPDAVAVLGTYSAWQVEELATASRPVVVVLDGDAHESGWALAQKLRILTLDQDPPLPVGSVRLPPGKDPDQVPRAWLLEEAMDSLQGG